MSGNPWDIPHLTSTRPKMDPSKITVCNMRFCPYAERAVLVLLAKNLPFDVVNINLTNKPEWFLAETEGKVPVLYHNNDMILESLVICDYLDEMYPSPKLHPESPAQKAKDLNLIGFYNRGVTFLYKILASIYRPDVKHTPEDRRPLYAGLVEEFRGLDKEMGRRGTPFLGGQSPAMIDYMIWPHFERVEMLPLVFPGEDLGLPSCLPHLMDWVNRMKEVPAVARYRLEPQQLAKWHETYRRGNVDYDFLIN